MNFLCKLSKKDIQRSKILFYLLIASVFLVPFTRSNIAIRGIICFVILLTFINAILIFIKMIKKPKNDEQHDA